MKFIETLKKEYEFFKTGSPGVPNKCRLSFGPAGRPNALISNYWIVNFHLRFRIPRIKKSIDYHLKADYIDDESLMDL